MKVNYLFLPGIVLIAMVLYCLSLTNPVRADITTQSHEAGMTSTVTALNPALFHKLNTILERGLSND